MKIVEDCGIDDGINCDLPVRSATSLTLHETQTYVPERVLMLAILKLLALVDPLIDRILAVRGNRSTYPRGCLYVCLYVTLVY